MTRRPTMDEVERVVDTSSSEPSDALGYYERRDRWETLGRRVATLRDRARELGVPLESIPGARSAIAALQRAGEVMVRRNP